MGWFFELAKLQCCYHFIKNVGDLPMIKKINFPVLTEMWNMLDLHFSLLICVVLFSQFIWFDKAADLNGICPDFCHYIVGLILSLVYMFFQRHTKMLQPPEKSLLDSLLYEVV